MKKRWKVNPENKALQEVLGRELNILPVTAQLLVNRGLVDSGKAFSFLKPELKDLHDPFLFKDMDKAVERIFAALSRGDKIALWGDYDVDGTTSTALLYLFFREIGVEALSYIPSRQTEGYGLNAEAIKKLHASGVKLIITVDCGISNHDEVAFANSLGLNTIVSDHHELEKGLPPAFAVLNPKRGDCPFPFKWLAGVGVAFNLAMALRAHLRDKGWFNDRRPEPNLKKYLDLVAIGTVADLVPLVDENRVLVSHGLKELERTERIGLKALMEAASLRKVDAESIAFQLAPRINAAGRLSTAQTALRLLVSDDAKEAVSLASDLNRENSLRQRIEEETLTHALSMLECETPPDRGIVLASDNWNPGVIGIVASRLADRFSKPAVMIALDGEAGKGSARGIKSFNILEGLKACSSLLDRYGGHKAAAGLTIPRANIERFKRDFIGYINGNLRDDDLVPEISIDAVVSLSDIDKRLVAEIESLAPFGQSNSEPLLCLTDAHIVATEVVGTRHLRLTVRQDGRRPPFQGIGFGLAPLHPIKGAGYGIAFSPYFDDWQGIRNLKLRIKDVQAGCVKFLT